MLDNYVMITGEKESFVARVLVKKLKDAGAVCEFVHWDVNSINAKWEKTEFVIIFMEEGEKVPGDVLHFLKEQVEEKGIKMAAVGEKNDLNALIDRVPGELLYKTFPRPVDNEDFVSSISDYMHKAAAGEFKKSVLIVDDDASYLNLVREWLKGTYKVSMANSGLQAIKWLGKNKADLILLDHEMPVTTGPQVLEMLRSDADTKDIPVIFLTGKSDKESVMKVVALKPEGYFLKTIDREELLEKLSQFFILHKKG